MAAPDEPHEPEDSPAAQRGGRTLRRLSDRLRRLDAQERLVAAAQAGRRLLPGDSSYGDPLSVSGDEPPSVLARRLSALTEERPSALREVGLSALQVWQSVAEAQGRGHGHRELAIVFTDLVDFSSWSLKAGDTLTLELLRKVGLAVEPPMRARGGRVVKRLGDGLMVVFADTGPAVEAALDAVRCAAEVDVGGHRPRLRAGVHVGTPRKLGGDYFGVDVNIAARVAAAAGPEEVLVSDAVRDRLGDGDVSVKRRWRFSAKGAPKDLRVYAVQAGSG